METRQEPFSLEAEQAVIASCIISPENMHLIAEILIPDYFYTKAHRDIYSTLYDMYKANKVIDLVTLKDSLDSRGILQSVGGIDYIIDISSDVTLVINYEEYAKIVLEKYLIRQTIQKATDILKEGYDSDNSAELIEYAERSIFELSKLLRSEDFVDWDQLINDAYENIVDLLQNKGGTIGLKTGFKNLDDMTNGLHGSDLLILAARPSVGKTAFALNLARNVAVSNYDGKANVAIFSLEMGADQLLTRLLAAQSSVPIYGLKTGDLSAEEHELAKKGLEDLRGFNMHIDETAGISVSDLKSKCRKIKLEKGLDFVVIDYLQLMTTNNPSTSRQQEVSEISRELKALAKELNIPVLALSQLSRAVESRADKKPMMSDIRESGAIEQDADIIMMLYRPEYYGTNIELAEGEEVFDGKTQLLMTKHRNGATGELDFKFMKEINKFAAVTNAAE